MSTGPIFLASPEWAVSYDGKVSRFFHYDNAAAEARYQSREEGRATVSKPGWGVQVFRHGEQTGWES